MHTNTHRLTHPPTDSPTHPQKARTLARTHSHECARTCTVNDKAAEGKPQTRKGDVKGPKLDGNHTA